MKTAHLEFWAFWCTLVAMEALTITDLIEQAKAAGRPVSRRQAAKLCQLGTIQAVKVGGQDRRGTWVLNRASAERWLEGWVSRS